MYPSVGFSDTGARFDFIAREGFSGFAGMTPADKALFFTGAVLPDTNALAGGPFDRSSVEAFVKFYHGEYDRDFPRHLDIFSCTREQALEKIDAACKEACRYREMFSEDAVKSLFDAAARAYMKGAAEMDQTRFARDLEASFYEAKRQQKYFGMFFSHGYVRAGTGYNENAADLVNVLGNGGVEAFIAGYTPVQKAAMLMKDIPRDVFFFHVMQQAQLSPEQAARVRDHIERAENYLASKALLENKKKGYEAILDAATQSRCQLLRAAWRKSRNLTRLSQTGGGLLRAEKRVLEAMTLLPEGEVADISTLGINRVVNGVLRAFYLSAQRKHVQRRIAPRLAAVCQQLEVLRV